VAPALRLMKAAAAGSKMWVNPEYVLTGRGPYINWHQGQAPEIPAAKAAAGEMRGTGNGKAGGLGRAAMAEGSSRGAQGSRRPRQQARRCYRVEFTLTGQEMAALAEAAGRVRLARGAYAAQVVLAHVNGSGAGPEAAGREALGELITAAGLVRKIGVLLNVRHEVARAKWMRRGRSLMVT